MWVTLSQAQELEPTDRIGEHQTEAGRRVGTDPSVEPGEQAVLGYPGHEDVTGSRSSAAHRFGRGR